MHYHSRFLSLLFVSGLIGSALPMSAQTFQVKATVSASTLDGTSTSQKEDVILAPSP